MSRMTVRNGVVVSSNIGSVVKGGTFTISVGQTSVVVTHNLGVVPAWAIAASSEEMPAKIFGVINKTSTQFTVSMKDADVADVTGYYACSV